MTTARESLIVFFLAVVMTEVEVVCVFNPLPRKFVVPTIVNKFIQYVFIPSTQKQKKYSSLIHLVIELRHDSTVVEEVLRSISG